MVRSIGRQASGPASSMAGSTSGESHQGRPARQATRLRRSGWRRAAAVTAPRRRSMQRFPSTSHSRKKAIGYPARASASIRCSKAANGLGNASSAAEREGSCMTPRPYPAAEPATNHAENPNLGWGALLGGGPRFDSLSSEIILPKMCRAADFAAPSLFAMDGHSPGEEQRPSKSLLAARAVGDRRLIT